MKRLKCKICGTKFYPKSEDKYIAQEKAQGLMALTKQTVAYDAFNCPQCGCQILVNEILPVYNPIGMEASKETDTDVDGEVVCNAEIPSKTRAQMEKDGEW